MINSLIFLFMFLIHNRIGNTAVAGALPGKLLSFNPSTPKAAATTAPQVELIPLSGKKDPPSQEPRKDLPIQQTDHDYVKSKTPGTEIKSEELASPQVILSPGEEAYLRKKVSLLQNPSNTGQKPNNTGQKPNNTGQKPNNTGQKPNNTGQKSRITGQSLLRNNTGKIPKTQRSEAVPSGKTEDLPSYATSTCSVKDCPNRGGYPFPKDAELRKVWIKAVRHLGDKDKTLWKPAKYSVVCQAHFKLKDYPKEVKYSKFVRGNLRY